MSVPTNTATTTANPVVREDLENVITKVEPMKTRFISMIGGTSVQQPNHEWATESLVPPNPMNASFEGADAVNATTNYATKLGNYTQRFEKVVSVSGTAQASKTAGGDVLDRQVLNRGIELRRDMEARFIGNYGSAQENGSSSPRYAAGAQAFIQTNVSRGASGTNGAAPSGSTISAYTPGTNRPFTQAILDSVINQAFNAGAEPSVALCDIVQKTAFAQFSGIVQNKFDVSKNKQAQIVGAADIYVGNGGEVMVVAHEYHPPHTVLLMDPEKFAVGTLRGVTKEEIAKTGDSDRFMLTCEKTLVCWNEKAHALIADLT